MPSSSSKQHNFMEAIAHSPSFAKKAGVPQSVGKDYAAADKGKTFGKGGEMKESKAMVGKEVAFFKKKGAPKSMIKHEEAEMMKRGGKVRRMAGGGMGDPFERDTDYEAEKAQGAKNLEGIKSFFGFGKKKEEESEARPSKPSSSITSQDVKPAVVKPAVTERASTPTIRAELPTLNPESDDNARKPRGPQFANSVSDRGEGELSGDGLSPAQGYKPSSMSSASRRPKEVSVEKEKTKVTARPGYKRSGATAEELERYAGPFRVTESANKMRKESEDKILDKQKGSMTKQMREAPSVSDLYKGQKSMSDEIGDALKSFRASIRSGLKTGEERRKTREAEASAAKGGQVKKMAQGGYAKADGIASRGKTQPKMVKMAGGGFVKSADGCAQRGKTRASQVKMSRGGKC